jgi:hypothetical protein
MTKKREEPALEGEQPEAVAPEAGAPEAETQGPKARASKRTKAMNTAAAKVRACKTMAELQAVWADLKDEQRDWAAYYETGRRIAGGIIGA